MRKTFYRWLAKWRLIRRYRYLNEVNRILEEYITKKIMDGGSAEFVSRTRQELIQKQNEITEAERMIDFLKRIK